MLFLFRSAPEVEKRIHSKLFCKFLEEPRYKRAGLHYCTHNQILLICKKTSSSRSDLRSSLVVSSFPSYPQSSTFCLAAGDLKLDSSQLISLSGGFNTTKCYGPAYVPNFFPLVLVSSLLTKLKLWASHSGPDDSVWQLCYLCLVMAALVFCSRQMAATGHRL